MDVIAIAQWTDLPVAEETRAGVLAEDFLQQAGIMALSLLPKGWPHARCRQKAGRPAERGPIPWPHAGARTATPRRPRSYRGSDIAKSAPTREKSSDHHGSGVRISPQDVARIKNLPA